MSAYGTEEEIDIYSLKMFHILMAQIYSFIQKTIMRDVMTYLNVILSSKKLLKNV